MGPPPFRSLRFGLSFLTCATVALWFLREHQSTDSLSLVHDVVANVSTEPVAHVLGEPAHTSQSPELAVLAGHWEYSHLRGNGIEDISDDRCRVDQAKGTAGRDIAQETSTRRRRVASWEWVFDDGTRMPELDWNDLVRRAVQSRFGIIYIGDSLTNQMDVALKDLIRKSNSKNGSPVIIPEVTVDDTGMLINKTAETLFEGLPLLNELMVEFPHIPRERFNRPIITNLRSDHLVSRQELADLMERLGVQGTLRHELRSDADWAAVIDAYDREGGWEGELPGYIIVNTGAHFSPAQIQPSTDEQLLAAYDATLEMFKIKINAVGKALPHRIIFRGMSPGHPGCQNFNYPQSNATTSIEREFFGWHLFQKYNEMAQRAFATPGEGERPILYWDIWNISLQRPDAHSGWKDGTQYDCLHWCEPSVPDWWWRVLWHTLELEEASSLSQGPLQHHPAW